MIIKKASTSGTSRKPSAVKRGIHERVALRPSIQMACRPRYAHSFFSIHPDQPEEKVLKFFLFDH